MKKLWKRNQLMITALALMIAIAGYLNFMGKQVDEEALFTTSAQFEETDEASAQQPTADGETAMSQMTAEGETASMPQIDDVTDDELALIMEDTDEYDALTDIDSMDSDDEMVYSDYLDEGVAEEAVQTGSEDVLNTVGNDLSAEVTEDYTGETPGEAVFTSGTAIGSIQNANLLKEQTREKNKAALLEIINSDSLSEAAKQEAVDNMIALTDITQRECSAQIMLEAKGFENVIVSISGDQADVIVAANELTDAMRAQIEDIVSRKTGVEPQNIIISPVAEN